MFVPLISFPGKRHPPAYFCSESRSKQPENADWAKRKTSHL
jgi:hypothetical protein